MPSRRPARRPPPPVRRVSLRAAAFTALFAVAVGVALSSGASRIDFDPKAVGQSETRMWRAYYGGDVLTLGREMLALQMSELGVSANDALAIGEPLARAAATFSNVHENYERDVLPALVEGYTRMAKVTGATWDPNAAAKAELAWWLARRSPGENAPQNVGRLIADLYSLLYGKRNPDIDRAGLLRAEAANQRDKEAARGQTPSWSAIEAKLVQSYTALKKGASR
ncbi:MAG: hypothetical protein U0610_28095 [bacterium]